MQRAHLILPTAVLAALGGLGAVELGQMELRLVELHGASVQTQTAAERGWSAGLVHQADRLEALERQLRDVRQEELAGRLARAQIELDELRQAMERDGQRFLRVDSTLADFDGRAAEFRAAELRLEQRVAAAEADLFAARELAERQRERLEELESAVAEPLDSAELWRRLMGPVVQIAGRYTVGSGVLLASQPRPTGTGHRTFVLTAWHVVRDVQEDPDRPTDPVPISIYLESGGQRSETAHLLAHDRALDVALLELDTDVAVPHGARLASPARLARLRPFDPVTAVGCPLGNDPIPTMGQVASADHRVDDTRYLMINAPTYIGNSGGAIYDGQSLELIGIFSKIYNHGTSRPTIVPHMGLVVPLDTVYTWLEEEGYLFDGTIAGLSPRGEEPRGAQTTAAPKTAEPGSATPASSPRAVER